MQENFVNENIRARNVRLISTEGTQLGVVLFKVALEKAYEQNLDLVQVSYNDPPTCKIMDYSKFKFEQKKKEKEQKRNQKVVEIKEIQLTPRTDVNDLKTKISQASKFLSKGNHIRITMKLRGREVAHSGLAIEAMNQFLEMMTSSDVKYKMKQNVKFEGRMVECAIQPL